MQKVLALFYSNKMEIVLLGLENSGKTTLLNQLSLGQCVPSAPTIGLNIKQLKKDGVSMKVWDIGGQVQYRREWGKYTKGCDVILFMVDASNVMSLQQREVLPIVKRELNILLEDTEIHGIPMLIIGNKIDIEGHMKQVDIIQGYFLIKDSIQII